MALDIRIRGRDPSPSELPPPGDRRGTVIVDPGRANPPLPVYVTREALEGMRKHARSGGDYEVGGFLLGGYHHHQGDRYVDITVYVPALKAHSARTHLTFSNEAQREFHAAHGARYPDKLVLGWYHTHPAYGLFLSEHDVFVQRHFFSSEHHVAVVIDPYQQPGHQFGVFTWHQGDITQGYHLIVYVQE